MTKYYAVIDTNVIVSSLLKDGSIPNKVVNLALYGPIIPLLNDEIIDEYREVLLRNKFGLNKDDVDKLIEDLSKRAVFLKRTETDEQFADLDDVVFYEIVLTGRINTDAHLVTGNIKHYPKKPFIVTPRKMLEIIENDH